METLIHADIFFFITSVAMVVLTLLLIVGLFYFLQILRNFRDISNTLKKGVDHASNHLEDLVETMSHNPVFRFLFGRKKASKKYSKKE
jgi:hypothetical protein